MAKFIGLAMVLLVIASALAYIGIARPSVLWQTAKIQNLIGRLGDGGARAFFLGLSAVNVACAILAVVKGRTAG